MHNKTVVSLVLAMVMASSGFVFGQGNSRHDDRGYNDRGGHEAQRGRPPDHRDDRGPDRRDDRARDDHGDRGGGPNNSWYRGDRIPVQYRSNQYVVDDWRGHHLSSPPRGYHWVQSGGDYILVALATGVIMQLLLNH